MTEVVAALRELASQNELLAVLADGAASTIEGEAALRFEVEPMVEFGGLRWRAVASGPGRISAARPMALEFDTTALAGDPLLWWMTGGAASWAHPSAAFQERAASVNPELDYGPAAYIGEVKVGSRARSADGDIPVLLLEAPSGAGVWFGLGFSGGWNGVLRKLGGTPALVRLSFHLPALDVSLEAGEELALPWIYAGAYRGGRDGGWAAARSAIKALTPPLDGGPARPWVTYNSWFNENARIDHARLARHLGPARDIGIEHFCIDATWYGGEGDADFEGPGLGTWTVDPNRFPAGLAAFAEEVRAHGMGLGLWFEPERAHRQSWVAREHPEWTLGTDKESHLVVNLGVPAAREWVVETISRAVIEYGLSWVKWDMNHFHVDDIWAANDLPDRRGLLELRHVEGLYLALDELMRRHPGLIVEGCASGGNRIDIEVLRRCHSFWLSDQTFNSAVVRNQNGGAALLLPASYRYSSLALGLSHPRDDDIHTPQVGTFGIMEKLAELPPVTRRRLRDHVSAFKAIRHLLDGEYQRIRIPGDQPLQAWESWHFHDPATGEGAVFVFRQHSRLASVVLPLQHIQDGPHSLGRAGRAARQTSGARLRRLRVSLEERGSTLLHYQRLD